MVYLARYTPEPTKPAKGPQPGTVRLTNWTIASWDAADKIDNVDPVSWGIFVPRDICGNLWPDWRCVGSQHARGAASDIKFPVVRPGGHPEGWKYARWLVKNYRHLGIQEVIWAGQRWTNQTLEWRPYDGRSDHFDHVHWAQSASPALRLTYEEIVAVAPRPPGTPPPTEERPPVSVFVASALSDKNWWLMEDRGPTGIRTLIPTEDHDNVVRSKVPLILDLSDEGFARFAKARDVIRTSKT